MRFKEKTIRNSQNILHYIRRMKHITKAEFWTNCGKTGV